MLGVFNLDWVGAFNEPHPNQFYCHIWITRACIDPPSSDRGAHWMTGLDLYKFRSLRDFFKREKCLHMLINQSSWVLPPSKKENKSHSSVVMIYLILGEKSKALGQIYSRLIICDNQMIISIYFGEYNFVTNSWRASSPFQQTFIMKDVNWKGALCLISLAHNLDVLVILCRG